MFLNLLAGGTTLAAQVANILRKYGTDAHVYLPGIGVINGLTAGNYLDSAGTTAATVDNPVGLVLDGAGSVGAELVTNGDFSNGDTGWTFAGSGTVTYTGGVASFSIPSNGNITQNSVVSSSNKLYKVTFEVTSYTSGNIRFGFVGGSAVLGTVRASVGVFTEYILSGNNTNLYFVGSFSIGFVGSIDNISVKEVIGIHATQSTTANKPILRYASGKYSWQFDGNDSLALGSVPFQMADNHCVIAGLSVESTTASQGALVAGTNNTAFIAAISINTATGVGVQYRNDALTFSSATIGTAALNEKMVISARNVSGTVKGRKNAGAWSSSFTPAGVYTLTTGYIGRVTGAFNNLQGSIYPAIMIKGTVSDADLLILEKGVGILSGVTI